MLITDARAYSAISWLNEGWENLASFRVGLQLYSEIDELNKRRCTISSGPELAYGLLRVKIGTIFVEILALKRVLIFFPTLSQNWKRVSSKYQIFHADSKNVYIIGFLTCAHTLDASCTLCAQSIKRAWIVHVECTWFKP